MSFTDMLDKAKALGLDAVEMTAGGWGVCKHVNTAQLLAVEDYDCILERICGALRKVRY